MSKIFSWSTDKILQKNKPEPLPPFVVGEVTNLIAEKVDFKVQKIVKSRFFDDRWEAYGKAIVTLPSQSTQIKIKEVADANGIVREYSVHYLHGKTVTMILERFWNRTDRDGNEICRLIVNEVEVL